MRSAIVALCLIWPSVGWATPDAPSRATVLYERMVEEGLTAVAADKDLTNRDRSILRLKAEVSRDGLAQAILGPDPVESRAQLAGLTLQRLVRQRSSCQQAGGGSRFAAVPAYTVLFNNLTASTLEEVVVIFQKKGHPLVEPPLLQRPFPAFGLHTFILGDCLSMESYVIGVYVDGLYIKIPAGIDTPLTPSDVSRFHPQDNDPCSDAWVFTVP